MHSVATLGKRISFIVLTIACMYVCLVALYAYASTTGFLLPTSDGNYTQWTPKSGTSHFAMVDESICNGTTDYNSTTVVGRRDSYVVSTSSVPNGAKITQIDIKPCASRNNTGFGSAVMNVFYRFGGVNSSDSGAYSLTGTTPAELATTSFSSLSLLQTATTALESGVVFTSGTKGARLSRVVTLVTYTPLSAPTSLVATATTSSAIGLTWVDNSSIEDGFVLERSPDGSSWSTLATTSSDTISYYDFGLTASTSYSYRVRAFNFGAYTTYSNTATAITKDAPPSSPSSLSAIASTTKPVIVLTWADNSLNETNFEVLRGTDGLNFAHVATTSSNITTYSNSGLASSTAYYYEVRAYNSGGYSALSAVASSTTSNVPAAPSDLFAVASTTAPKVELSWTDNADNELSFFVTRKSATSSFAIIAINIHSTTYTDASVASSTTYDYEVYATNGYGTSTPSNIASATTTFTVPNAPTNLSLSSFTATSTTDITLMWVDNSTNELAFDIQRAMGTSSVFSHLASTTADTTSYVNQFLPANTYTYRVRAYNLVGNSDYSNTASTTVP